MPYCGKLFAKCALAVASNVTLATPVSIFSAIILIRCFSRIIFLRVLFTIGTIALIGMYFKPNHGTGGIFKLTSRNSATVIVITSDLHDDNQPLHCYNQNSGCFIYNFSDCLT